ncbi:DNA translocase FtsK 4TM domain-containing protein, partial [Sphingomonas bacterium]|uniref:DNA translocase FtsK 4TM domain-containing protein n=1 Tax=Sphingomonas bacterium TaxID=1895847 RepID=UPI001577724F
MATRLADGTVWTERAGLFGRRGGAILGALAILALVLLLGFALASYHSVDPAMNTAAGGPPVNVLGAPGAWAADLLLTLFGLPVALLLPPLVVIALRLWRGAEAGQWKRALPITVLAMALLDVALGLIRGGTVAPLPAGLGGAIGLGGAGAIDAGLARIAMPGWPEAPRIAAMLLLAVTGLACAFWAMGLSTTERQALFRRRAREAGGFGIAGEALPDTPVPPKAARRRIEPRADDAP